MFLSLLSFCSGNFIVFARTNVQLLLIVPLNFPWKMIKVCAHIWTPKNPLYLCYTEFFSKQKKNNNFVYRFFINRYLIFWRALYFFNMFRFWSNMFLFVFKLQKKCYSFIVCFMLRSRILHSSDGAILKYCPHLMGPSLNIALIWWGHP